MESAATVGREDALWKARLRWVWLQEEESLLQPGAQPTQIQKWYDRLAEQVAATQERLRRIDPARLAQCSGGVLGEDGTLWLEFWGEHYRIPFPDLIVRRAYADEAPSNGRPADALDQALLLAYLATADGALPSGRYISYRDLPDGMFYAQAFRGYAEMRLVRELERRGGIDAFRQGAGRIGGAPLDVGSAGYSFRVLPRVRLAAVYWLGDEDFPSQASILFEDTATHYMSTDGLAVLGSHLVNAIVKESD
jgi:hypothetical protein